MTAPEMQTVHTEQVVIPLVREDARVTPLPPARPSAPGAPEIPPFTSSYEWEKVRDYVIEQILARQQAFPRDIRQENTIFMGFGARWEGLAMKIARYAFDVADGEWLGAPISVHRFGASSDPVFAKKIAAQI